MSYDRPPNPLNSLAGMVHRGRTPVTNGILIGNVVLLIAGYAAYRVLGSFLEENLVVSRETVMSHPWSLLLYPLYPPLPIMLFFWGFTFWQFGGSLERSWGSARYGALYLTVSAISALSIILGTVVLHTDFAISSFLLPLASVLIAFCSLNPSQPINCWFVNIPNRWFIAIVLVLVWFLPQNPLLGLFAEGGPLLTMWYIRYGRVWAEIGHYTTRRRRDDIIDLKTVRQKRSNVRYLDGSLRRSPFDLAGQWRDRKERQRLERLLRNSGMTDPEDRRGDNPLR
jgi:membrane associated rhomboid family serine protease